MTEGEDSDNLGRWEYWQAMALLYLDAGQVFRLICSEE
jgi:hypothetical protein